MDSLSRNNILGSEAPVEIGLPTGYNPAYAGDVAPSAGSTLRDGSSRVLDTSALEGGSANLAHIPVHISEAVRQAIDSMLADPARTGASVGSIIRRAFGDQHLPDSEFGASLEVISTDPRLYHERNGRLAFEGRKEPWQPGFTPKTPEALKTAKPLTPKELESSLKALRNSGSNKAGRTSKRRISTSRTYSSRKAQMSGQSVPGLILKGFIGGRRRGEGHGKKVTVEAMVQEVDSYLQRP